MEHCSTDKINENISNELPIGTDVQIDEIDNQLFSVNAISTNLSYMDDVEEPWEIEEDSDECDIDINSRVLEDGILNNLKILGLKKCISLDNRKLNNSNTLILKNSIFHDKRKNHETDEELNSSAMKKINFSQENNIGILTTELNNVSLENNIYRIDENPLNKVNKEQSEVKVKIGTNEELLLNTNINNDGNYNETYETSSFNSSNLSNNFNTSQFYPTDLPHNNIQNTASSCIGNSNNINWKKNEQETELLFNFFNKTYLNDSSMSIEIPEDDVDNININEDIEISHLEECDLIKKLSKNMKLENDNENLQTKDSECFVEDPDIVNPDIMYNINLNEHYKQMDYLVKNITKTSDDQTILNECMQLMPIPQIEHEQKTFTKEERINFVKGISEWEYDIDGDDWNKIMVKRAVVFTAHAGFSIANEESLYVLADVAIDYIKKLAIIIKKNFDIQSKSSRSDDIDPINNSLQEIGVKGGVKELIKHYENDVFGRRNRLMKKCLHLQKIIDQYMERMLLDTKTNNQYSTKDGLKERNLNDIISKNNENLLLKEINAETEVITEEIKPEVQSTTKIEVTTQSKTEDNEINNSDIEQTESDYIDNSDIEVKMETDYKNIENNKTNIIDSKNAKIKKSKVIDIDLLKPIIVKSIDYEPKSIIYKTEKSFNPNVSNSQKLNLVNIDSYKRGLEFSYDSESHSNRKKMKKLFDINVVKSSLKRPYPTEIERPFKSTTELNKMLKDFDNDFKKFKSSHLVSNNYNSSVLTKLDNCTPIQRESMSTNYDKDEKNTSNKDVNEYENPDLIVSSDDDDVFFLSSVIP